MINKGYNLFYFRAFPQKLRKYPKGYLSIQAHSPVVQNF